MAEAPVPYSLIGKRVFVAGHRGMVGSAIVRRLRTEDCEVLIADRSELDLRRQSDVERWFGERRPHAVFHAAGTVGGIFANATRPAEFLFDNLAMEANVIEAAYRTGVEKLLFLGSSCIYPREADQPIHESALLSGPLEATNEWYAVAKIAGIKLTQAYRRQYGSDFISVMPTNLYGPGDNFDLRYGHVLPALMRKVHEAKAAGLASVEIWGSGRPRREFLYVEDLADACVFSIKRLSGEEFVNIGTGQDLAISAVAKLIADTVGFDGRFVYDPSKPDGTPRKLLDVSRLKGLGWEAPTSLIDGLRLTYDWFRQHIGELRKQY